MSTISLPGGTAELKDDVDLTNKEVKKLRHAARIAMGVATKLQGLGFKDDEPETWRVVANMSDDEDDAIDLFQRTCVIMRLKSWTLEIPMPTDVDEVDNLPRPVYVPLTVACADIKLNDTFGIEGAVDPKAGTES